MEKREGKEKRGGKPQKKPQRKTTKTRTKIT
jgi:hypothetical protein